jgi:predicted RNase H-like HicB family nuclease
MLFEYMHSAMKLAHYDYLQEDKTYYGEIPGFQGVFTTDNNLETCRDRLAEVLEEWLFFRISRNLPIPAVDGIELQIRKVEYA